MALLALLTQTKAKIGGIELDCSVNETHERSAELTKYPVEDGGNISDNVVLLPKKLTIEGLVSKTPLGVAGLIGSAATAGAGAAATAATTDAKKKQQNAALSRGLALTGAASIGGLVASAIFSRDPADVFAALDELYERRIPFTVVTALTGGGASPLGKVADFIGFGSVKQAVYQNMILTSLNVPRNAKTVNALRFTATMEQVTIVSSQLSLVAAVPGAAGAQNLGKQAATAPSAGSSAAGESWLVQLGAPGA